MSQVRKQQMFNDGFINFYLLKNTAETGDVPVETLVNKAKLRYHQRTIGINRIYSAKHAGETVDNLIRCPKLKTIRAEDIAITEDGKQYLVKFIQYPEDIEPPVMDLTLVKTEVDYDIG